MADRLTKTMGAGLSALGGGGKTFFVVEHKSNTSKHKAGESQQIIVDYVEMGRDSKCAIRFTEAEKTVSRRHAAIQRDKDGNYLIKNLSATNPTLVNGRPVENEWFLKNGDEIQLSLEGPKMSFLTPSNNKTSTIGMTRRLSLFAKQALRPYRTQMRVLTGVLVLAIAAILFMVLYYVTGLNPQLDKITQKTKAYADSISTLNKDNKDLQARFKKSVSELELKIKQKPVYKVSGNNTSAVAPELSAVYPSVYFVLATKLIVEYSGETQEITDYNWSGTGFLLTDGRFITARHVVEPWFFYTPDDESMLTLNLYANNGGTVVAYFTATSPDGTTITFKSTDFAVDRTGDAAAVVPDKSGNELTAYKASLNDGKDWASYVYGKPGKIAFDNVLSQSLKSGNTIHIVGYPYGMTLQDQGSLKPFYSKSTVAQDGLVNGVIHINDRNFDHGNSGGPVFYDKDGKYYAVGIISAGYGTSVGCIVPVSAAK